MLRRVGGYLLTRDDEVPPPIAELQADGYTVLRSVLRPNEVARLREEIEQVYRDYPADGRAAATRDPVEDEDFRYGGNPQLVLAIWRHEFEPLTSEHFTMRAASDQSYVVTLLKKPRTDGTPNTPCSINYETHVALSCLSNRFQQGVNRSRRRLSIPSVHVE